MLAPQESMQSEIGPAWLLLSHSGFLAAMLVSNSIGFNFLITEKSILNGEGMRGLCIMSCVLCLVIGFWVFYAIFGTWKENRKVPNPTYGDAGFISLILIVILIMSTSIWTISEIILR